MTPEERFTKIENVIAALTERQAHYDAQIEKQNAGIRDLAAISRTLIEAQQRTNEHMITLAQTVDRLTLKVDQLSDSVDRFLKGLQKPNGREGQ